MNVEYVNYISWAPQGSKHGQVYGKVLQCTKNIFFLVKHLKVVAKYCFNGICFHGALCLLLSTQI